MRQREPRANLICQNDGGVDGIFDGFYQRRGAQGLFIIFVVGNGHLTGVITRHDNFRFPIPQKDEGARHPYYQGSRTPHLVVTNFQFAVRTLGMRPLARQ